MKKLVPTLLVVALLGGCTIMPPPSPRSTGDPSDSSAPEAAAPRRKASLTASTRIYLDASDGADAQKMNMQGMGGMEGMDHSKMKGMGDMQGMDHSKMPGMQGTEGTKPEGAAEMPGMDHSKMKGMSGGGMEGMKMPMAGEPSNPAEKVTAAEEKKSGTAPSGEQLQSTHPTSYTCRMHPEVKSMKPGKCPKCGMTLVSKETVEKQKANDRTEPKQAKPQP